MSGYQNNSIFWVELAKIQPNPFQPRREFDPAALEDLADSIRQYGVLQPLVVTRKETVRDDDRGLDVHYELIAGERRLRAAKIAGLQQVPVIIRKETDNKVKLELAIIENLQREDLNPIDRALAFEQLHKDFGLTHVEIGKRMGKSRVYVSNSLRLLALPQEIKQGLVEGRISEGHTRPLLMLADRPEEQSTLYKEIMLKKMSVRDAEKVARKIAQDRIRKKEFAVDPKIRDYEQRLSENLGTRVHIEAKEQGGKIMIDYFSLEDLEAILRSMKSQEGSSTTMMERFLEQQDTEGTEDTLHASTGIDFTSKESDELALRAEELGAAPEESEAHTQAVPEAQAEPAPLEREEDTATSPQMPVMPAPDMTPLTHTEAPFQETKASFDVSRELPQEEATASMPSHQAALQQEVSAAIEEFNTSPEANQVPEQTPVSLPGEAAFHEEKNISQTPSEMTTTQVAPSMPAEPAPVTSVHMEAPEEPISKPPIAAPVSEKEVNPELAGKSFQEAQNAFFRKQQETTSSSLGHDNDPYREPISDEDLRYS